MVYETNHSILQELKNNNKKKPYSEESDDWMVKDSDLTLDEVNAFRK